MDQAPPAAEAQGQERQAAYTTSRPDVFALVPEGAMRVLDVGCSTGELGASLRAAAVGRSVVGIESDPEFCAQARHRLDEVICADLNQLQWGDAFPNDSFDCLIFADVLEHLVDPWSCLRSACACLRPGGAAVVSVPNVRHLSALRSIFLRGTFPKNSRGIFDRTHLRWFTIRDAQDLITQAGLTIERFDCSLRLGDRGDGLVNRVLRKVLYPVHNTHVVREFLAYQVAILAKKPLAAKREPTRG